MNKDIKDIPLWKDAEELKPKPAQRSKKGWVDPEVRKRMQRRKWNRTYHNKNKDKLNRKRRARAATPKGAFLTSRQRARSRGEEWLMTLEEWTNLWLTAPDVYDVKEGLYRRPFSMRGRNPYEHVQLNRVDPKGPWSIDNVELRYRLEAIA